MDRKREPPDMSFHSLTPAEAMAWAASGEAVLIDVREQPEYDNASIEGAVLVPISTYDPQTVLDAVGDKKPVFFCKAGPRAEWAAAYFTGATGREAWCMEGSITGWIRAGLPVAG
jgi:rhodanese-related sulfurtransferase